MAQVSVSGTVWGQSQGTGAMLDLLRARPEGMDEQTWRVQRREAVRELGRRRVRDAVPLLLAIARTERFDAVLEAAIEALGHIADRRALLPLRRLATDAALDSYAREAAERAVRRIEASSPQRPTRVNEARPPRPAPTKKPPRRTKTGGKVGKKRPVARPQVAEIGEFTSLPPLEVPLARGIIARASTWDLALAGLDLHHDGATDTTSTGLNLTTAATFAEERPRFGVSVNGRLDLGFSLVRPPANDASWQVNHGAQLRPEVRYYPLSGKAKGLFGQATGSVGYGLLSAAQPDAERRLSLAGVFSLGLGLGHGRVVDVGPRLRADRLQQVLREAGLLNGPIPPKVRRKLYAAWYTLRDRLGGFDRLGYSLRILKKSGLLQDIPLLPAVVYRLIRVLDDPQLDQRPAGMLVRAGYGYARTLIKDGEDHNLGFFYATGRWAQAFDARHGLQADLRLAYQHIGSPDQLTFSLAGRYTRNLYTDALDPLGSLEGGLELGLSNQPGSAFSDRGLGYRLLAHGGYLRHLGRGSRLAATVDIGVDSGAALVLVSLAVRYGLANAALIGDSFEN